jgi:aspartate/methionine/tyrosine aminotransferase
MVAELDKRRKIVVEELNTLPGFSCITPKGAFYAFPNSQDRDEGEALIRNPRDAGVATIGGPDFGLGRAILASYANSAENQARD